MAAKNKSFKFQLSLKFFSIMYVTKIYIETTLEKYMRASLNIMPLILLCLPPTSEADFGGIAVETESFHKYSIAVFCCETDGSRQAV